MFFYNSAILMDGTFAEVLRSAATAIVGIFLLACAVQGWFMGYRSSWIIRAPLVVAALFMISGGLTTDLVGVAMAIGLFVLQKFIFGKQGAPELAKGRID